MALKESTIKKYKQISGRFQSNVDDFKMRNEGKIKISEIGKLMEEFLIATGTKNTFRTVKQGLKFWLIGFCKNINDKEKKKKLRESLENVWQIACGETEKKKTFEKRQGFRYRARLTPQKLEKLLKNDKINKKHKYLIILMVLTGARPSEIKNLKIENYGSSVVFEKIVNKKTKMPIKKSKIKYRTEDLQTFFEQYNLNLQEFLQYEPEIHYNEDTIRKIFARISQKTRMKLIPYSCRNFFSAEMKKIERIQEGFDKTDVSKALGHEAFQNQRFYGNSNSSSPVIPIPSKIDSNFEVKGIEEGMQKWTKIKQKIAEKIAEPLPA